MNPRLAAAGLGLALAGGLVVAGPVTSAFASDRPNTLADARKAAPTALNAWINDETIGSAKDQDWYHYELDRDAWVTVTLGAVPADYTLALYGDDGKVIATSARPGREFELITKKLSAGAYYVKVSSPKSSSRTPYRIRFRELPQDSVFVADQTMQFKTESGKHYGRFALTLFNSTSQWQSIPLFSFTPETASGSPTHGEIGGSTGNGEQPRRIAPGGTLPFDLGWLEVSKSTAKFAISAPGEPVGAPVASGLSIEEDPRFAPIRNQKRNFTTYFVLVHNTSSTRRSFSAYAKHYSTIGNLTDLGLTVDSVGPRSTASISIPVFDTVKTPNLLRFTVEKN